MHDSKGVRTARVSLQGRRVAIRAGDDVVGVPLAQLRRGPASALGLTLLRADSPDWRLFLDAVPDGNWPQRLPAGSTPIRRGGRIAAVALAVVGITTAVAWSSRDAVIAEIAPVLPHRVTEPIGRAYLAEIGARCEGPGVAALDRLASRMEASLALPEPVTVAVVDVADVNAVALPGGYVAIYRGLLDQAASADEVAGALAHEIAHVAKQHPNQSLIRAMGPEVLARVLGSDSSKLASLTVLTHGDRAAEAEADGGSIGIMRTARISTADVARFFERQANAAESGSVDFPDSHPSDATRAQRYRDAAVKDGTPAMSASEWAALKTVCPAK